MNERNPFDAGHSVCFLARQQYQNFTDRATGHGELLSDSFPTYSNFLISSRETREFSPRHFTLRVIKLGERDAMTMKNHGAGREGQERDDVSGTRLNLFGPDLNDLRSWTAMS